jgi:hypothetical protein
VPYSEDLADRVRDALGPRADLSERKMFGGIAFMKTSIFVTPEGTAGEEGLASWVEAGAAYAASLPPKQDVGA